MAWTGLICACAVVIKHFHDCINRKHFCKISLWQTKWHHPSFFFGGSWSIIHFMIHDSASTKSGDIQRISALCIRIFVYIICMCNGMCSKNASWSAHWKTSQVWRSPRNFASRACVGLIGNRHSSGKNRPHLDKFIFTLTKNTIAMLTGVLMPCLRFEIEDEIMKADIITNNDWLTKIGTLFRDIALAH